LKYWQKFLGDLNNHSKSERSKEGRKIAIWVQAFLILAIVLLNASILNAQLLALQLNTPEGLGGQKPPKDLKLSSILYELTIASDREKFAQEHDIFLFEGKVRVFLFFDPVSSNSEREKLIKSYNLVIEKKSDDLVRAMVPINELIPLSKEPVIWSIGLLDKPVIQGGEK